MKTIITILTLFLTVIQLNAQSFIDTYIHIIPDYGGTAGGELTIFECENPSATITKTITFDGNPLPSGHATGINSGVKTLHYTASDGSDTYEFEANIDFNSSNPSINYTITPAIEPMSVIQTHLSSSPSCDGEINLITSGGNPPVHFSWFENGNPMPGTPGQTSQLGLCPGDYGYKFGDASSNCSLGNGMMFNVTINEISCIVIAEDISCFGECDGEAELVLTGNISGVISTTLMNTSGDQDPTHLDNLCPGMVTGQIMDITGAVAECNNSIVEPDLLEFNLLSENSTGYEQDDGYAKVEVTAGDGPFNYNWTGPGSYTNTGDSIGGLAPGSYSVEITYNGGNCSSTSTFDITEPSELTITINNTTPQTTNPANGAVDFTILGGVQPYDTILDDGQTQIHGGPFDELSFGNYILKVVDQNGSTAETTFTINTVVSLDENQDLSTIRIYPNPANENISIVGEDLNQAVIYDMNGKIVVNQSISSHNTIDISNLESGVYTVVIEARNKMNIEKLIIK